MTEGSGVSNLNRLFKIIVGSRYGEKPLDRLTEIRAENSGFRLEFSRRRTDG